jgi:hypothetical protein
MTRLLRAAPVVVAVLLCVATPAAQAVLGGNVDTVQADTMRLRGERRLSTSVGYTVHEILVADGSVVREYANAQGTVFMVTWNMRYKPRLADLLGAFDAEYRLAATHALEQPGVRKQISLERGDLVVQQSAHLQNYRGRAWLRSKLPAGFSAEAIR